MKITYVYHSCYVVEFEEVVFIFDYYKGELPDWDKRKKVIFFASHKHNDHFSLEIFRLSKQYEDVVFVLSNDIKLTDQFLVRHGINPEVKNDIIRVGKRISMDIDIHGKCLNVKTLRSTDQGVAFLVHYEGKTIYHAGDLNCWSWSGISEEENRVMEDAYKEEINRLSEEKIDVAFLVLDPRQEERYWLGMDYFMKTVDVEVVFPMHCWEKYWITSHFVNERHTEGYCHKIMSIKQEGECFQV